MKSWVIMGDFVGEIVGDYVLLRRGGGEILCVLERDWE